MKRELPYPNEMNEAYDLILRLRIYLWRKSDVGETKYSSSNSVKDLLLMGKVSFRKLE